MSLNMIDPKPAGPEDSLYSAAEAWPYLNISKSKFYALVAMHNPRVFKAGRKVLYPKSSLDQIIQMNIGTHHFYSFSYEIGESI